MSDTYLVTGGAGFIGSNIVAALLERGHAVRVLDNFSTGRRSNLEPYMDDIMLVEGDCRSYERVHTAVRGSDQVIHLAALPSVPRSVQDPLATSEVNITGTLNVLLSARDEGVKRVVFASSSSVYGTGERACKDESMVATPLSPYGVSKLAAERYCGAFWKVYGLETVALRYFNVFGPRQDPNSQYSAVIPNFVYALSAGKQPVIFGDGGQTRDFTFVDNVVDATTLAVTAPSVEGEVFNVACGEQIPLLLVLQEIADILGADPQPVFEPARAGDIRDSQADITRAREALGYEPRISLRTGLERTVAHLLEEAKHQRGDG